MKMPRVTTINAEGKGVSYPMLSWKGINIPRLSMWLNTIPETERAEKLKKFSEAGLFQSSHFLS